MGTTAQTFGTLLKRYRTRAGISQEALAERAQLSVEAISSLERGVRRSPYRDTVALLSSALNLAPGEQDAFAAAALRPATLREAAAVRSSSRPVSGPGGNLPLLLTSFVGQEGEVAAIDANLRTHRLVTLVGGGGIGKTRVALEVAAGAANRLPDGAWFAEFGALTDPALIPGTIAGALRFRLTAEGSPLDALLAVLADKKLLLVLDNCEHLIDAVRAVATILLLRSPGITLLATSRQALGIAGETTFRIRPLLVPEAPIAPGVEPSTWPGFEAVTLFFDRACAVEPSFALTEQNVAIVADICRRLDGIPLAIELAATRVKVLSLRDLRDRLDDRFRILTDPGHRSLPRQQTLRALIDWSYELLEAREQELFRRVAVFAEGFTLEAARAICGSDDGDELDVLDLLASLVDKSLVLAAVGVDAMRYRLLESTRLYALEMLTASDERDGIEARHLDYFCDIVAAAERLYEKSGTEAPLSSLASDLENIRAALRYSLNGGSTTRGAQLAIAAARIFNRLGLGGEALEWVEAALDVVTPSNFRMQSRLWSTIGYLIGNAGGARSLDASERAVELARAAGDRELTAWSLTQYAMAAMDKHQRDRAEAALTEAEQLFGARALSHQRARILAVRLHIVRLVGDHALALRISEELRSLYRLLGNETGELRTTLNYAESLHACGDTERAIAVVREAMRRAEGHREALGMFQLNLTAYLAAVGNSTEALATGAQSIELLGASGYGIGPVAIAIGHLALAHALNGDARRAARLRGYSDASLRALDITREYTEITSYEQLSRILAECLQPTEREVLLESGAAMDSQSALLEALRP